MYQSVPVNLVQNFSIFKMFHILMLTFINNIFPGIFAKEHTWNCQ